MSISELNASLQSAGYEVRDGGVHDLRTGERLAPAASDGDILRFLVGHCGFGRLDRGQGLRGAPPGQSREDDSLAHRVVRAVWAQGCPPDFGDSGHVADAAYGLRDVLGDDPELAGLMVRAVWQLGWPADTDDEDCVDEAARAVADLLDDA